MAKGAGTTVPNDPIAEADQNVRVAVERAEGQPGDGAAQTVAARALAAAADLRLLVGLLQRSDGSDLSIDALIDLEDALPSALKSDVLGLVSAGLDYANRATKLLPTSDEAHYLGAFHLSLVAWAEGTGAAVLRGRGPDLARRMRDLEARAAAWDAEGGDPSAAWRLRGRFLDRAPWPYGDGEGAIRLLQVATERSPSPINFLFQGDALWAAGQQTDAMAAWHLGEAASSASPSATEEQARKKLIRARLDAIERSDQRVP